MEKGGDIVLVGEYRHNLDVKGRITLPSKFREELGEKIIVTRGFDGCLYAYTPKEWEKVQIQLSEMAMTHKKTRTFVRLMVSQTTFCEFDKMGRINIPSNLRELANLSKNCVIVGALTHIEIWDEARWEEYYTSQSDDFEDLAEEIELSL